MAFLFHRSLRLDDNLGLIKALDDEKSVLPVFCVDPRQADPKKNSYFSGFALGFMYQSLLDLKAQLQSKGSDLLLLKGEPHKVLPRILRKRGITKLYMNEDYTPFARKRVEEIREALGEDIEIVETQDYLMHNFGEILSGSGTAYRVYTSFLNASKRKRVDKPIKIRNTSRLVSATSMRSYQNKSAWNFLKKNSKITPFYEPGGRTEGVRRLLSVIKTQKNYAKCRDYLTYKTTRMSAYIKFGCVSIREAWHGFAKVGGTASQGLHRELIWREFYYHYYIAYPEELEWAKKTKEARLSPKAPDIVKACFKELDTVGYLHNRGRMILAHYILKYQKEYWKEGDRMYARRLVDYDPMVNIGNWRWIEKQPSFKTLKPETQFKRWDRACPTAKNKKDIEKGSYTQFWLNPKKALKQAKLEFKNNNV